MNDKIVVNVKCAYHHDHLKMMTMKWPEYYDDMCRIRIISSSFSVGHVFPAEFLLVYPELHRAYRSLNIITCATSHYRLPEGYSLVSLGGNWFDISH